jgi:hypothetical protein
MWPIVLPDVRTTSHKITDDSGVGCSLRQIADNPKPLRMPEFPLRSTTPERDRASSAALQRMRRMQLQW